MTHWPYYHCYLHIVYFVAVVVSYLLQFSNFSSLDAPHVCTVSQRGQTSELRRDLKTPTNQKFLQMHTKHIGNEKTKQNTEAE